MPAWPVPRPCFDCACGDHAWAVATRGYVVLVSTQDKHELQRRSWCATLRGKLVYAQARISGKLAYLHAWLMRPEQGQETDHRNRWGMDNRRPNLRNCTRAQNVHNTCRRNTPNRTSQFKGVHWSRSARKWTAQIGTSAGVLTLGLHVSEEDAARAYDSAARQHHGEFAVLNFGGGQ